MADGSGICYTLSGNEKRFESDLFEADINVKRYEYCYRCDLAADGNNVDRTLVFGEHGDDGTFLKEDHEYLPCFGLSINHNIQANGEDHYTLSGTYTGPNNWTPPPGIDGPFKLPYDLQYPYYLYIREGKYYINAYYGGIKKFIKQCNWANNGDYYGIKK